MYRRLWFFPRRCSRRLCSCSKYLAHSTQWYAPKAGRSSSGTSALSWASWRGLLRSPCTWSMSLRAGAGGSAMGVREGVGRGQ